MNKSTRSRKPNANIPTTATTRSAPPTICTQNLHLIHVLKDHQNLKNIGSGLINSNPTQSHNYTPH